MIDQRPTVETDLTDLSKQDWLQGIAAICDEDGYCQQLGKRHFAAFIESGTTLLVTFETIQGMHALSDLSQPMGWEMLKAQGWSHLVLASDGDTFFRDPAVHAYFDRLVDDGFFDEFETVLFYGAGPCGYAAAAYSVASPGAVAMLIQPQATLNPRIASWDNRFTDMRRADFTSRYGYAPDMLDAADEAFVLFDPLERMDAMHAALFTHPNVTKLRLPHMGNALQTDLMEMEILSPLLVAAAEGTLDEHLFATLYRERRDYRPYLRNLLTATERAGHDRLATILCRNVTDRMHAPKFARKLQASTQVDTSED